jgi:hypothetical protein
VSRNRILQAAAASALAAVLAAGVALAAKSPPLPQTGKGYTTSGSSRPSVTLVINASNPKVIQPGAGALGSQFAISNGFLNCPKAKKNKGFKGTPFVPFGFPGATLKLSHGSYGFSVKDTEHKTAPVGSSGKFFTLKVTITGKVSSATLITGTVKASGGTCTTKKALKYKAKLNPSLTVGPGQ